MNEEIVIYSREFCFYHQARVLFIIQSSQAHRALKLVRWCSIFVILPLRRSKYWSFLGSELDRGIVMDAGWLGVAWLTRAGNEKGRVGKSWSNTFRVGISDVPFPLVLSVKSAAGLLLIRAGSSFISMVLEAFVPRIEQLSGKKRGMVTCFPSKVNAGLRPRGAGGQTRGTSLRTGAGVVNGWLMFALWLCWRIIQQKNEWRSCNLVTIVNPFYFGVSWKLWSAIV